MTQEALKLALDALETELSIDWTNNDEFNASAEKMYEAIAAIKEALAKEKTLQALHSENERLGLYKDAYAQPEQEPVAWLLTEKNINSLQVDSIQLLINRLKHAHHTDLCVRINGQDEWFQADWLKHMVRVTPPQPEQEPVALPCCGYADSSAIKWNSYNQVVQCHNCGQVYTHPQRTWLGLAAEDRLTAKYMQDAPDGIEAVIDYIEAKLKELNG